MGTSPFDKEGYDPLDTFGFEQVSVAGTAVGLTAATYAPASPGGPAKVAYIQCETAAVRWRADGTDPTATVGVSMEAGDEIVVWGQYDIQSIKFIWRDGVTATLNVHYAR